MGQLPTTQVSPNHPFAHSGIDYAGPLMTKTWEGKNARTYKSYIALFVCFSTSAVHLELVTDYTTEAFMLHIRDLPQEEESAQRSQAIVAPH